MVLEHLQRYVQKPLVQCVFKDIQKFAQPAIFRAIRGWSPLFEVPVGRNASLRDVMHLHSSNLQLDPVPFWPKNPSVEGAVAIRFRR